MIMDAKFAVVTPGLSEDLVTSGTTPLISDYIDVKSAGYTDAGGELYLYVRVKATTAAAGASFLFEIQSATTAGGSYVTAEARTVLLAQIVAGKEIMKLPIPPGMNQFWKIQITGASGMTGGATFNMAIIPE